ncbi:hypothetical protein [Bacillus thuringiensis]|uniref:hypothetical protein n=2 Tax=Bacillus thuringiensis TaxID=1428 RepID=UPI0006687D7B|nr:hypothetical protein [Bacillus thuringiensis]
MAESKILIQALISFKFEFYRKVGEKMKTIPYALKQKLRQYDKYNRKAEDLHDEIITMIDEYGVPYDNLVANGDGTEPQTEALAYINNAEGNIEENIKEMEEVFLYFANKNKSK